MEGSTSPSESDQRQIESFLKMNTHELLVEIGNLQGDPMMAHSPKTLNRRGKETIQRLTLLLRKKLCHRNELRNLPELALALQVFAVLAQSASVSVICAVSAYVAKRGFDALCATEAEAS